MAAMPRPAPTRLCAASPLRSPRTSGITWPRRGACRGHAADGAYVKPPPAVEDHDGGSLGMLVLKRSCLTRNLVGQVRTRDDVLCISRRGRVSPRLGQQDFKRAASRTVTA